MSLHKNRNPAQKSRPLELYVQSRVERAEILDRVSDSCSDRGVIRAVSLNSNCATADILNRRNEFARCRSWDEQQLVSL
jgi:hypothetical protein